MDVASQAVDLVRGHPEGLADVAHGAAGPIADDGGGQGRPLATVFLVDVLDDLLAALVLEVHVDVRRLAALPGDEALEEHLHACRVDLGDPQAVADRRVGGRAPPLAEDATRAGEGDDVVDREEIGLIAQFRDQGQLVLDEVLDPQRDPLGPAAGGPGQGQAAEIRGGHLTGRDQLVGVLVAQLVQGEAAGVGNAQGLRQQVRRVEADQLRAAVQVGLAVLVQGLTGSLQGGPQSHGGEGVEQGLALGDVHAHPARRRQRQAAGVGEPAQAGQAGVVPAAAVQGHADPDPAWEPGGQAATQVRRRRVIRQPEGQAAAEPSIEV